MGLAGLDSDQLGQHEPGEIFVDLIDRGIGQDQLAECRARIFDAVAEIALPVAGGETFFHLTSGYVTERPVERPTCAGVGLAEPRDQPREVQTPVIRPYPRRGATNRKPADARCRFRRDDTGLAQIPAVP